MSWSITTQDNITVGEMIVLMRAFHLRAEHVPGRAAVVFTPTDPSPKPDAAAIAAAMAIDPGELLGEFQLRGAVT